MPEPTGGTPSPESATQTGGTQEGANASETLKITPEMQKLIDEQISAATKKANDEAARHRLKLKEIEDKQKAEADAKLQEEKKFEELANTRKTELETLKAENERLKKIEESAVERDKQRHADLLKKIPETQRDVYKTFTTEQLEIVLKTIETTGNSQGNERQNNNGQQAAKNVPVVPFEGQNSDVIAMLTKALG